MKSNRPRNAGHIHSISAGVVLLFSGLWVLASFIGLVKTAPRTLVRFYRAIVLRGTQLVFLSCLLLPLSVFAKKVELTDNGPDVKIPTKIWDHFGEFTGKDSITFSSVKVRLVEKTPGVLVEPEVEIKLPRGGGQIDLSQFVVDKQGTFRVFFDLEEMTDEKELKAYFISRARKRKIDGEVWGAGCNKYMNIKPFMTGAGQKTGIEVNTTRLRHLSVLGGTFFFSSGPLVTQVTLTDSKQSHLFCDSVTEK